MGAVPDIQWIAERLLKSMRKVQLADASPDTGEFRIAGPIPGRLLKVIYHPDRISSHQDYEMHLEERAGDGPVELKKLPFPIFGKSWIDIYLYALGWLVPESEWPDGAQEYKVTGERIQCITPRGPIRWPMKLSQPLADDLQGTYRLPKAGQGVFTEGSHALEQFHTWVAMGWRVEGIPAKKTRRKA